MEQREPDLGKQLKGLWRHKWLILLTTVVAGGTALVLAPKEPPIYEATATIMVESRADPLAMLPDALAVTGAGVLSRDMGTQILVIQSRGVLERAIRQVEPQGETDPEYLSSRVQALRESLEVNQVGGTRLMDITVSAPEPKSAQELPNAVAQTYIAMVAEVRASSLDAALEQVDQKQNELGGAGVDHSLLPQLVRLAERSAVARAGLEPALAQLVQIQQHYAALPDAKDPAPVLAEGGASRLAELTEALRTLELAREQGLDQKFTKELSDMSAKALSEAGLLNAVSVRLSQLEGETTVPSLALELQAMADEIDGAVADVSTARGQLDQLGPNQPLELIATKVILRAQLGTVIANLEDLSRQMSQAVGPNATAISISVLTSLEDSARAASFALAAISGEFEDIATGDLKPVLYGALAAVTERINTAAAAILSVSRQLPRLQPSPAQEATLRDSLSRLRGTVSKSAAELEDVSVRLSQEAAVGGTDTSQAQDRLSSLQVALEVASWDIERLKSTEVDSSAYSELTIVGRRIRGATAAAQDISDRLTRAESDRTTLQEQFSALEGQLSVALAALEEVTSTARAANPEGADSAGAAITGKIRTLVRTLNSITRGLEGAREAGLDLWVDEDIAGMTEQVRAVATWLTALSGNSEGRGNVALLRQTQVSTIARELEDATAVLGSLSDQLGQPFSVGSDSLSYADLATAASEIRELSISLGVASAAIERLRVEETGAAIEGGLLDVEEKVKAAGTAVRLVSSRLEGVLDMGGDAAAYRELESLRQNLELSRLSSAESGIRVVDWAARPQPSSRFPVNTNGFLGGVAGLLLGVIGGLVLEYTDRRVRDAGQAKGYLHLPLLAQVPRVKRVKGRDYPSAADARFPAYPESLRILRTNIELTCSQPYSLLVTSPSQSEGKTAVAVNLARVLAMQGRRVLLIDADLRKPDVARALGLPKGKCVVEALANSRDPLECVAQADGISVLACDEPPENPAELLSSPQMKDLIHRAKERYDAVVLDSAPVVGFADTKALAREVDTAILVLQADSSDLEMALETKEALTATGARVLGFVFNRVNQRRGGYGYYKAYRRRATTDKASP